MTCKTTSIVICFNVVREREKGMKKDMIKGGRRINTFLSFPKQKNRKKKGGGVKGNLEKVIHKTAVGRQKKGGIMGRDRGKRFCSKVVK